MLLFFVGKVSVEFVVEFSTTSLTASNSSPFRASSSSSAACEGAYLEFAFFLITMKKKSKMSSHLNRQIERSGYGPTSKSMRALTSYNMFEKNNSLRQRKALSYSPGRSIGRALFSQSTRLWNNLKRSLYTEFFTLSYGIFT